MTEWTDWHEKHADKIELVAGVDCWIWIAASGAGGYGRVSYNQKAECAHRAAYIEAHGGIPGGSIIRHLCHNRMCVRPGHLRHGTHLQNSHDTCTAFLGHGLLNGDQVRELRRLYEIGVPLGEIAGKFGLAYGSVYPIVSHKAYAHVDPHLRGRHTKRIKNRITDDQIMRVRTLIKRGVRNTDIARATGVNSTAISNIRTGVRYESRGDL